MTLTELQVRVAELARHSTDITALQEAARLLATASNGSAAFGGAAAAAPGAPAAEGSMSREEFLRRLRGA